MSELIAFIGVGNMGLPMAENLKKSGKKIKVFDVSKKVDLINTHFSLLIFVSLQFLHAYNFFDIFVSLILLSAKF